MASKTSESNNSPPYNTNNGNRVLNVLGEYLRDNPPNAKTKATLRCVSKKLPNSIFEATELRREEKATALIIYILQNMLLSNPDLCGHFFYIFEIELSSQSVIFCFDRHEKAITVRLDTTRSKKCMNVWDKLFKSNNNPILYKKDMQMKQMVEQTSKLIDAIDHLIKVKKVEASSHITEQPHNVTFTSKGDMYDFYKAYRSLCMVFEIPLPHTKLYFQNVFVFNSQTGKEEDKGFKVIREQFSE